MANAGAWKMPVACVIPDARSSDPFLGGSVSEIAAPTPPPPRVGRGPDATIFSPSMPRRVETSCVRYDVDEPDLSDDVETNRSVFAAPVHRCLARPEPASAAATDRRPHPATVRRSSRSIGSVGRGIGSAAGGARTAGTPAARCVPITSAACAGRRRDGSPRR